MNRKLLESHGVFYEENPGSVSDLPSHVDYLRSALLDFDFTISHRFNLCEDITDMREFNLNDAFHKMNINDGEQKTVRASIERYKEIQETAFFLTEAASIEYKWQKLFADFFFDPLRKAAAPLNGDSRRVAREKFYYHSFEDTATRPWTLFSTVGKVLTRPGMGDLTEPRSDYVAYFKIFDHDPCDGSIDNSSPKNARVPYNTWPWGNSARKGLVKNFSRRVLEHLAGQGLEPCVANIYRAKERAKIDKSECMCFPWLVVEHKRTPSNRTEHCYSQAANGAHAVLTMHRILAKFVDKQLPDTKHIPPVTTITTIGSHVKVWVAYAIGEDNSCKTSCIWEGDITRPFDIIRFEAILENLHTYVMHELRPWISSYIDQWLHQFPLDASHSVIAREEQRPKKADASGSASSSSELCIPLTPSKPYIAEFESAAESEIVMMLRDEHRNFLDKITSLIAQSASMTYHHFQESFGQLPTPSSAPETPLTLVSSPGSSSTESDRAQETPLTDYDEMSPEPFCSSEKQLSRPKLPPTLRRLAENEKSPSPKPRMKIPSPSTSDDEFYSPEQGYSPLSFKIVQVDAKGEEEMPMTPDGRETPKTQSRLAAPICNLPQADKSAQKRPRILFPDLSDFDKNENQRRHSDILHTPGTAELSLSSSKEEDFYRRSKSTSDISRNSENRPRSVSQSRV